MKRRTVSHISAAAIPKGLVAAAVFIGTWAVGPVTALAETADPTPNLVIAADKRQLTTDEIQSYDKTGTPEGQAAMAKTASMEGSIDLNDGTYRVFIFPGTMKLSLIIGASTKFDVFTGLNSEGEKVHEVVSVDSPAQVPVKSGYYPVPPKGAFEYYNHGQRSETVGSWHRDIWWSVSKANNWKACADCTAHDYYRYYAKVRGGVLQEYVDDEGYGYKRLWVEINRNNDGWANNLVEFEAGRPEESYQGQADQVVSVGFGASWTFNIGIPPVTAGGTLSSNWGGSMTRASEHWHPVLRSEVGTGGVQWCRYTANEYEGTKTIAGRTSVRVPRLGDYGGFRNLVGMAEATNNCPNG